MKLSAPIYVLKAQAKELKKSQNLTLIEALNVVAQKEGFSSWSLLQTKAGDVLPRSPEDVLVYFNPGDLVLIGSRPGQGKTSFTLQLLIQGVREGKQAFLFSLEEGRRQIASRLADLDLEIGENHPRWTFDFSDEISADYIIAKTQNLLTAGSLIAVDYLQLLDQRRSKPDLQKQIESLNDFAKAKKCVLLFISQMDRGFEDVVGQTPGVDHIRLPNPLDLKLFNKILFIHQKKIFLVTPAKSVILF